jgi:hypothetical protein
MTFDYLTIAILASNDTDDVADLDDETPNPEACPDCGCLPCEGYTDGCPACQATVELLCD